MEKSEQLATHLNIGLVCLSVAIAVLASYAALDLTRRALDAHERRKPLVLAAAGITMGLGIWSMHFVGMQALQMDMTVTYDLPLMTLSLLAAIAGAWVALAMVAREHVTRRATVTAAAFLGLAIASMHYLGMASMQMAATIHWNVGLILASLVIAFSASLFALWLVGRIRTGVEDRGHAHRLQASVLLGLGIAGLHYTATAASTFHSTMAGAPATHGVSTNVLVALLAVGTMVMLGVLLGGAGVDQRRAALASDMELIAAFARELSRIGDARARICEAILRLAGADLVLLIEPRDGVGAVTHAVPGTPAAAQDQIAADPRVRAALDGAERAFVADAHEIHLRPRASADRVSALFEPLPLDDRTVGVLVVVWDKRLVDLPGRMQTLLSMLAAEAAVALDRENLVTELDYRARHDELTGLLNRRTLGEELTRELALVATHGRPLSLLMLDLDHFKSYNDAHGHQAGDGLLKTVADSWQAALRSEDVLARYGGEEFVAILPNCSMEMAIRTADRLRACMPSGVTCSAGAACTSGSETGASLISRADGALYLAKSAGRNRTRSAHRSCAPSATDVSLAKDAADSERRRTGAETREVEIEAVTQAALVDEVDVAVTATDLSGLITHWNRAAHELHGFSSSEAIGRRIQDLVSPVAGTQASEITAALEASGRWEGQVTLVRKDGSTLPAYVRNRAIGDQHGRPIGMVSTAVDVSERVASEAALLAARNYALAVTDCMGEGLFTIDDEGCVTYLNDAARELLGFSLEDVRGRNMHFLVHSRRPDGSSLALEDCRIQRARKAGVRTRVDDEIFVHRDGHQLDVEYTVNPFRTEDGVQGCVVVFDDITERRERERGLEGEAETLAWVKRVQDAIDEDRLTLFAQPIVDLGSGLIVQKELLLRIRESTGETVAPSAYLDIAETYGLIGEIDRWVIDQGVQLAARGLPVEINVSARSVGDWTILDMAERCIQQTGADPRLIVFEITETALIRDAAAAHKFATRLHELGCKLALDDFGTGYGSFTYLKHLPIDYLKIDIEFVRDLPVSHASRHVVKAVVELARSFDLRTIAEGVEDPETLELLRELGVDYAQGFAIGRPAPLLATPVAVETTRAERLARRSRGASERLTARRAPQLTGDGRPQSHL